MYSPSFRSALAVGPDIHIDFMSCEEMRRKSQNLLLIKESYQLTQLPTNHKHIYIYKQAKKFIIIKMQTTTSTMHSM